MAGQNQLRTVITIGGNVDNSFGRMGEQVAAFGSQLERLSRQAVEFGKESVNKYADYEDDVLAIEAKFGDATRAQMDDLDDQMRNWAANTRYTATQVSAATKEAATAGWELNDVYSGMPVTLNVAAGANMELAETMGYLNSMIAGMNLSLDDAAVIGDQWLKTANSSRASAADLGESFEALGSLATFADSSEELFTMLSVMSKYGTKGSEAGTLLRNVMLRMITPTKKASQALADLGFTEEEISEALDDTSIDLGGAAEQMEQMGISAFDTEGKLLPITKIVSNIRKSVKGMSEKEMYDVLGKIFPTRTIRGIMDLLRSSDEEYAKITESIVNSTGYAAYAAELQESGLGGSLRKLNSRYEELQLTVGEHLAPVVEQAAGWLGDLCAYVSDLDDETLDGFIGALGGIAAAGSGLMVVGGAMRLIGMLATPGGAFAAAVIASAALAGSMYAISEANFRSSFGNMEADIQSITPYLSDLQSDFAEAYSSVNLFDTALGDAVTTLTTSSSQLSSDMLTAVLTNAQLSDQEIADMKQLGNRIANAVHEGILQGTAADLSELDVIFSGEGDLSQQSEEYQTAVSAILSFYDNLTAQAEEKSKALRDAMTKGFADGKLTAEERQNIIEIQQELSELLTYNDRVAAYAKEAELLYGSSTLSYEGYSDYTKSVEEARANSLALAGQNFWSTYATARVAMEKDGLDDDEIASLAAMRAGYQAEMDRANAPYDEMRRESAMSLLDGTGIWSLISQYATTGSYADFQALEQSFGELTKGKTAQSLGISDFLKFSGGNDYLDQVLAENFGSDFSFENKNLGRMVAAWSLAFPNAFASASGNSVLFGGNREQNIWKMLGNSISADDYWGSAIDDAWYSYVAHEDIESSMQAWVDKVASQFDIASILADYAPTYLDESVGDDVAKIVAATLVRNGNVGNLSDYAYESGEQYAIQAQEGFAEAAPTAEIELPDGLEKGTAFATSMQAALDANPGTFTVNVKTNGMSFAGGNGPILPLKRYAEGGYADTPSIFGEAGPEWAVPQEHTQRTAELLASAAAASGFTWPELLSRTGGLNANAGHTPSQIIYSPTIIAQDASGVEQKLADDKERFEKWWDEKQAKEGRMSYA